MILPLENYSIVELRAMIEWRKDQMNSIYANWDSLPREQHDRYTRYQAEIHDMVSEIDRRKEARKQ